MDKVLFTRSVDIVPMRKGIYKDPMKDTTGFRLLVTTEKAVCDRLSCEGCDKKDDCQIRDTEKNMPSVAKKKRVCRRRRKWGEDPEYDAVMCNFGMTPGEEGTEIEQHIVFGWANVTVQEDGTLPGDWQGDMIETEVLETAAYNYVLRHGLANQEHEYGTECGWLVESMMFTKEKMDALGIPEGTLPEGWFVGFYIPDPEVYAKVKDGTYNMFSIEGTARRVPLEEAT